MTGHKETSAFANLLGQRRAKAVLERVLRSRRIAHAFLFRGPDGVGKKGFAEAMAVALNCRSLGPVASCGECSSCRKFLSGNHPDYVVESPEKGTIKIESVRRLCRTLGYAPYESQHRVVVIEDVHAMGPEAANSLLKTLEEPPENNILILTAESTRSLLPTIASRCQKIDFYPLTVEETASILVDYHDLDEERSRLLARLSEGSPGRALLMQERDMIEIWKKVIATLADPQYLEDREVTVLLQLAQQMAELKENLPPMLGLLRLWLHDRYKEAVAEGTRSMGTASGGYWRALQAVDQAEFALGRNCNRALVCETLLFRLQ